MSGAGLSPLALTLVPTLSIGYQAGTGTALISRNVPRRSVFIERSVRLLAPSGKRAPLAVVFAGPLQA